MAGYTHGRIAELERALMLAPARVRTGLGGRLEVFILSLDRRAEYPYDLVYFRVTGFHHSEPLVEVYPGESLIPDLALLLERVSGGAPVPAGKAGERVLTVEEVSALCNVAVRTVLRWRRRGLVSRLYRYPDGRDRIGIRQSALEHFTRDNRDLVERSGRFSRMSEQERSALLRQADALSRKAGLSLTAAARRIAGRTGRARETIRSALKRHRREAPADSAFRTRPSPLRPDERARIGEAYRAGQSAGALARRFGKSRATIHRIINQVRAQALLKPSAADQYVPNDEFLTEDADRRILGDGTETPPEPLRALEPPARGTRGGAAPGGFALDAVQERGLFRKYNYMKYRLAELKKGLNPARYVPSRSLDEIEALLGRIGAVRKRLLGSALDLAVNVALQHGGGIVDPAELVGEGVLGVVRAIDRFDYRRGGRFRAYAAWELRRSFARTVPEEHYRAGARRPAAGPKVPPAALWDRLASELGGLGGSEREALRRYLGAGAFS